MKLSAVHHVAVVTANFAAMKQFYTEVLGLEVVGKFVGKDIIFLQTGPLTIELVSRETHVAGTNGGWDHFAFEVENTQVLLAAKADLEARGLKVVGPTNHDDFILSIYFFDPSGHRLELTTRTCPAERYQVFESEAPQVLALWNTTHDWSQRAKLFGAQTGYARKAQV